MGHSAGMPSPVAGRILKSLNAVSHLSWGIIILLLQRPDNYLIGNLSSVRQQRKVKFLSK